MGNLRTFLVSLKGLWLHHNLRCSPQLSGNPKNLHVSLGAPRRTFILGRPWCVTTSLLWGVSDAQQVAYAVTLLRKTAHEWFMVYKHRNQNLPRDWPQLADLLLERFRSNILSQEAQSQ